MQILRLKGKWNEAIGYLSVRPHNMYNEPRSLHCTPTGFGFLRTEHETEE